MHLQIHLIIYGDMSPDQILFKIECLSKITYAGVILSASKDVSLNIKIYI